MSQVSRNQILKNTPRTVHSSLSKIRKIFVTMGETWILDSNQGNQRKIPTFLPTYREDHFFQLGKLWLLFFEVIKEQSASATRKGAKPLQLHHYPSSSNRLKTEWIDKLIRLIHKMSFSITRTRQLFLLY